MTTEVKAQRASGIEPVKVNDVGGQIIDLYNNSHALVIGNLDYTKGWSDLPGVADDIEAVVPALEHQGFTVQVAKNVKSDSLDILFRDFIFEHGQDRENRLLFYFAGHGASLPIAGRDTMGYIVPTDVPPIKHDTTSFRKYALDMGSIANMALEIQSKHALFIFDSCFSGSLFNMLPRSEENYAITYNVQHDVRQFITSGSASEQVPDRSIFRDYFVAALKGEEGDLNGDGYLTGRELGSFLYDKVTNLSLGTQHPQYGTIKKQYLDRGDFVFVLPQTEITSVWGTGQHGPEARERVQDVLERLSTARSQADQANAQVYATDAYQNAEEDLREGEKFIELEDFPVALQALTSALGQFQDARVSALERRSEIAEIIDTVGPTFKDAILTSDEIKLHDLFGNLRKTDEETYLALARQNSIAHIYLGWDKWSIEDGGWRAEVMVDINYLNRRGEAQGLVHLYDWNLEMRENRWIITDYVLKDRFFKPS